jgi:arabinoxylan arabinofuranohydrolase
MNLGVRIPPADAMKSGLQPNWVRPLGRRTSTWSPHLAVARRRLWAGFFFLCGHAAFCAETGDALAVIGNPLRPGVGLADPHVVIYGDRAYIYATHDFSSDSTRFVTKDWWVWSSTDLVNWKQAGTLRPEVTFLKRPSDECWAGFGATRNGKYYWYFSAGPREIGVVEGDSPIGPWKDPLGKPLVARGLTPTQERDPDILMDDDGQAYMVYGTFSYFIVRLGADMISLAETPRPVVIDRKFGPYGEGKTDDKPSLHKRNGIYYLSWSSFYAMSSNLYGPYTFKGSVIAPEAIAPEFQIIPAASGYDLWHDRHGNFFTWHHQWYYACNDKSQPGRSSHFRDCCLSYVHYRDNGEMAPIRLDRIGVGQYDALQPQIEAEDYFDAERAEIRECPAGGFEVRGLIAGSRLVYPNVNNVPRNASISFHVASAHPTGGTIEIRETNGKGRLLGICPVPETGGWDKYHTVSCALKNQPGSNSLGFTCKGGAGELMRLDWFKITASGEK